MWKFGDNLIRLGDVVILYTQVSIRKVQFYLIGVAGNFKIAFLVTR